MADRTFKLAFVGDASKALGAIGSVDKGLSGLGSKVQGVAKGITLAATGAIAGGLAYATQSAMTFEKQFSEVATLLPDMDASGIANLRKEVLATSKEFGIATDKAVPAFYQAISSGVPASNVADFMRVASKAAIGGVTELETAVDGISTAINSYGVENLSAQKAADIMFTTVKLGKTNFAQLSQSLFNVLPTANSLGVTFEDVSASLAAMTLQGVPTSVATTQLRQAFVEASNGGSDLDKAIRKLNGGQGFADLIKKGMTSSEIFDALRQSMPEQKFRDMFGSVEALNAALAITGDKAPLVNSNMEAMGKSAGAVDAAFETVAATTQYKYDKAVNSLKVSAIELGTIALPYVTKAIDFLSGVLDGNSGKWTLVIGAILAVITGISALITVVTPIIGLLGMAGLGGAAAALGPLIAAAFPFLLVAAAVAAIIAAGYLLITHWDEVKAKAGEVWSAIANNGITGSGNAAGGKRSASASAADARAALGITVGQTAQFGGGVGEFASGGFVPGSGPKLAIVHGGEEIRTPAQQRGGGNIHIHVYGSVHDDASLANKVRDVLNADQRRGSLGFA